MPRLKIFVGGAHGTGKGSICTMLANELYGTYISASELLKWNKKSKYVDDVVANQHSLSELLRTHTNGDSTYIIVSPLLCLLMGMTSILAVIQNRNMPRALTKK